MPYPAALGQRPLDVQEAYEALAQYAADYGREALLLLIHAAVPETLRADLLHLIRANFLPGHGADLSLEADVLFAPLSTALGGGYYRIDPQVRWHALALLRARYRDEQRPRPRRVAELLWRYVESAEQQATRAADPQLAEFLAIQRWVALAFLEPASAAHAFADALRQSTDSPASAALRLGGLASAIELPLAGEQELLAYARGLDALVSGDRDEGRRLLEGLADEVKVGDIVLKAPGAVLAEHAAAANAGPTEDTAARRRSCLVLMGFGRKTDHATGRVLDLDRSYAMIRAALAEVNVACLRADEIPGSGPTLYLQMLSADLVICDLSARDPGALYLLGVCMALRPSGALVVAEAGLPDSFSAVLPQVDFRYTFAGEVIAVDEQKRFARALQSSVEAFLSAALDALLWPSKPVISLIYSHNAILPPAMGETRAPSPVDTDFPPEYRDQCFVIQGFGLKTDDSNGRSLDLDASYAVIREAVQAAGLRPLRADEVVARGPVARQVEEHLYKSGLVIADLSACVPDVLLQLGIRHGMCPGRTLLVAEQQFKPPAELADLDILRYEHLGKDLGSREAARFRAELSARIRASMSSLRTDSPVYLMLPNLSPPRALRPPVARVFISYVQSYARYVRPLVAALKALNVAVSWDVDLTEGENWAQALADLLEKADAVVCVAGRETAERQFPMAEIDRAVALGKRLIPVLLEPISAPRALIERQAANPVHFGERRYLTGWQGDELQAVIDETARNIVAAIAAPPDDAPAPEQTLQAPRLLTIRDSGAGSLTFLLDENGRREWALRYEPARLAVLLRALHEEDGPQEQDLKALADLLLPEEIRRLPPSSGYRLLLNRRAYPIPWELLFSYAQRTGFLPVIRRPDGNLVSAVRPNTTRSALFIGNPLTRGSFSDENPRRPPPSAAPFDAVVRSLEEGGIDVAVSVGEDASTVIRHLYGRDAGILLISGSSVREYGLPGGRRETGFVLSDGMFLTVKELQQLRIPPELVILHDTRAGHGGLSEEMAPDLLKAGVRCVIAAAWDGDQEPAAMFIQSILVALAGGERFEDAFAGTIRNSGGVAGTQAPWVIFQAWGDPDYRFLAPSPGLSKGAAATNPGKSAKTSSPPAGRAKRATIRKKK